jgi:hypothetical protein
MNSLQGKVLSVTVKFLGPAAGIFLDFQTRHYLKNKSFEEITNTDMPELIRWLKPSACLFIGKEKTDSMIGELKTII